jgi:hypothetical protein
MSFDFRRIYIHTVLGALGGLIGWALTIPLAWLQLGSTVGLFLKDALIGALVGLAVGAALGAYDGLFASRSSKRLLKGLLLGGLVGLVGGALGLIFGEAIFLLGGGGVWPRALGWALFGALVGSSQGISQLSLAKVGYGMLGGLLGGLIGGSTYERLSVLLQMAVSRELGLSVGGAIGLTVLGVFIGGLVGLVEIVLRTAWLSCTRGLLEGQTITLDPRKKEQVLGVADDCDVVVPGDPDVLQHHAAILRKGTQFVIEPHDGPVLVRDARDVRGTREYAPVDSHTLDHEDRFQLGKTRFTFLSERKGGAS